MPWAMLGEHGDTYLADAVIVGSGPAALRVALKCIKNDGATVIIMTHDKKLLPTLDEQKEKAPRSTTAIAPMRGWQGHHYLSDLPTVNEVLTSSFALFNAYPDLAKEMQHPQTDYHFLKGSSFSWEKAQKGLKYLSKRYAELYQQSSSIVQASLPHPDSLYHIVDPQDVPDLNPEYRERIHKTIVTYEGIINLRSLYASMKLELKEAICKNRLKVFSKTEVTHAVKGRTGFVCVHGQMDGNNIVCAAPAAVYAAWHNNNKLIKSTLVKYDDGKYYHLSPPAVMTARVKQIVRGYIKASVAVDCSQQPPRLRSGHVPLLQGVRSSFSGYSLYSPDTVMLAVTDNYIEEDGDLWREVRGTSMTKTNITDFRDDGEQNIQTEVDRIRANIPAREETAAKIWRDICHAKRIPEGSLRHESWHIGTVMTDEIKDGIAKAAHMSGGPLNTRRGLKFFVYKQKGSVDDMGSRIVALWCMKALHMVTLSDQVHDNISNLVAIAAVNRENHSALARATAAQTVVFSALSVFLLRSRSSHSCQGENKNNAESTALQTPKPVLTLRFCRMFSSSSSSSSSRQQSEPATRRRSPRFLQFDGDNRKERRPQPYPSALFCRRRCKSPGSPKFDAGSPGTVGAVWSDLFLTNTGSHDIEQQKSSPSSHNTLHTQ